MNEQRTPEWFKERLGVPTGSNFGKILTGTGKRSDQRWAYMYKLAAEEIFQEREETYRSDDMNDGIEYEPEARAVYAMNNEIEVIVPGFKFHASGIYGCSVDGLIGTSEEPLEIKCPKRTTHIATLHEAEMPIKHVPQVQGHILVYEKPWCDFFSYYPKLPEFQIRIYRDEEYCKKLDHEITVFNEELQALIEKVRQ